MYQNEDNSDSEATQQQINKAVEEMMNISTDIFSVIAESTPNGQTTVSIIPSLISNIIVQETEKPSSIIASATIFTPKTINFIEGNFPKDFVPLTTE